MSPSRPCYRHRTVWKTSCPDCTAWHLATELARRDRRQPGPAGPSGDGLGRRPGPDRLPVAA